MKMAFKYSNNHITLHNELRSLAKIQMKMKKKQKLFKLNHFFLPFFSFVAVHSKIPKSFADLKYSIGI